MPLFLQPIASIVAAAGSASYTAPKSRIIRIESIWVCNRETTQQTYSIAVCPGGSSLVDQHYLISNKLIPANDTHVWNAPIILAPTDSFQVFCASTIVAFNLFGEVSG